MENFKRLPKHIGIIPDGNRRWAVAKGLSKKDGYGGGFEPAKKLCFELLRLGIPEVTDYMFTQENTRRPKEQVDAFRGVCIDFIDWLKDKDVSIQIVGDDKSPLFPKEFKQFTQPPKKKKKLHANFLVNYSWKWDLDVLFNNAKEHNYSSSSRKNPLMRCLGSSGIPRVDLLIRWGGRMRLSGFLPVQTAYSDIFVIDELWPDFEIEQFHRALRWYEKQDITLGG